MSHVHTWFGAVIVLDNLKSAVIRCAFGAGADAALNRSYVELARHYGVRIDPTPPRSPEKKGKVERAGGYVKYNFLATHTSVDIEFDRAALQTWVREIASTRRHGVTGRKPIEAFEQDELRLCSDEVERRGQTQLDLRLRRANFDGTKRLDEFEWKFNPKIPKAKIIDLGTCSFVARHESVLIVGPTGVGKSHVAKALGERACRAGHGTIYTSAHKMLGELPLQRLAGEHRPGTASGRRQPRATDRHLRRGRLARLPASAPGHHRLRRRRRRPRALDELSLDLPSGWRASSRGRAVAVSMVGDPG